MTRKYQTLLIVLFTLWTVPVNAATFVSTQNMSFGTLIPTSSSGSAILSTAGVLSGSGFTIAPSGTAAFQGIAKLTPTLIGIGTLSVVTSTITLTNSTSGGGTVTVNNITTNPAPGSLNISLLAPINVNIGGIMTFNSGSKGGTYNGTVTLQITGLLGGTLTANVPVTLTLWNTLSMEQVTPLNFGAIERLAGNSVVRIAPQTGTRTVVSGAGGINLISSPPPTAGQFSISGQPNVSVSIALPSSTIISGSNGGTMTVNNFTGYPSSTSSPLNNSGELNLYVGADLNIGAAQTSGTYSGTYTVTVNY